METADPAKIETEAKNMNIKPQFSNLSQGSISMKSLILSILGIVIVCAIVSTVTLLFVIPKYIAHRDRKLPTSVMGAMRTINAAQAIYLERSQAQRYGTMEELIAAGYIDKSWASGNLAGYKIEIGLGSNPIYQYWVKATPLKKNFRTVNSSDQFYYFTNQGGVIRLSSTNFQVNNANCMPGKGFSYRSRRG